MEVDLNEMLILATSRVGALEETNTFLKLKMKMQIREASIRESKLRERIRDLEEDQKIQEINCYSEKIDAMLKAKDAKIAYLETEVKDSSTAIDVLTWEIQKLQQELKLGSGVKAQSDGKARLLANQEAPASSAITVSSGGRVVDSDNATAAVAAAVSTASPAKNESLMRGTPSPVRNGIGNRPQSKSPAATDTAVCSKTPSPSKSRQSASNSSKSARTISATPSSGSKPSNNIRARTPLSAANSRTGSATKKTFVTKNESREESQASPVLPRPPPHPSLPQYEDEALYQEVHSSQRQPPPPQSRFSAVGVEKLDSPDGLVTSAAAAAAALESTTAFDAGSTAAAAAVANTNYSDLFGSPNIALMMLAYENGNNHSEQSLDSLDEVQMKHRAEVQNTSSSAASDRVSAAPASSSPRSGGASTKSSNKTVGKTASPGTSPPPATITVMPTRSGSTRVRQSSTPKSTTKASPAKGFTRI